MTVTDPESPEIVSSLLDRSLALVWDVAALHDELQEMLAQTTLTRVDEHEQTSRKT